MVIKLVIKTVNGNKAVAEAAKNCRPEVVACYPITPATQIAEELDQFFANNELKTFIAVESEFSAISAVLGGSAAGSRSFTATSSQGLLLMHEVLFAVSGMRFPVVMAVANRAVSAPLSIWNDEQDSISQRDTGWIQLYCKNNQEAVDSVIQAFEIAETTSLPVMVCIDGHYLTHAVGQVDIPTQKETIAFLPEFKPRFKLDPKNPLTLGAYTTPAYYQEFREDLHEDLLLAKKIIVETGKRFEKKFKRAYGLFEEFQVKDAEIVLLGLGSAMDNVKLVVEELRKKGKKAGCVHVRCYRPFPSEELSHVLKGKTVGVIDRALSFGAKAPLYVDVLEALRDSGCTISSFYGCLGGRNLTRKDIMVLFEKLEAKKPVFEWIGKKESKKAVKK